MKRMVDESREELINKKTYELNEKLCGLNSQVNEYENLLFAAEAQYAEELDILNNIKVEIDKNNEVLANIKAKQQSYIEAQKKKEEINLQKDYYRLKLSSDEIEDIQTLKNIQKSFTKKEAIDKIIWEVYYRPAFDILSNNLQLKDKLSGIYRITSIETDKSYIGQSVNIKDRFKSHIRSAIEYGTKTNKLYSAMSAEGIENFIFEILEIVPSAKLNERETYYIDLYGTKEYGLNIQKGGGK